MPPKKHPVVPPETPLHRKQSPSPAQEEIARHKQTEQELKTSEQRFRDVAGNAREWIWEVNAQGKYIYASPVVEKLLGYTPAEILQKHFYDLFRPEERESLKSAAFAVFATRQPFQDFVNCNVHKNGQAVWLSTSAVPLLDGQGNLLGYRGADMDITARRQAEEALRASEEKYRSLFNNAEVGMFQTRLDGSMILDMNEKFLEIFGFTRSEMQGSKATLYWADPRERAEMIRRLDAEGRVSDFECSMLNQQGEVRRCLTSLRLYPEQGLLEGSILDITGRKQAEQALKESEARFRALIDQASIGINLSRNGKSVYANPELLRMFGLQEEEAAGLPLVEYFAAPHQDESLERTRRYSLGLSMPPEFESVCRRKDGMVFPVHVRTTSVELADGPAVLAFITDITERKQAEEALKEYNTRLETAVEARTLELRQAQEQLIRHEKLATLGQMAGGVGHELRNPLGIINSAVYYLKLVQPDADEKIKKYHRMIEQEVQVAGMIIADLLDFARLPSADPQPVSLPDLLQRVLPRYPVPASVRVVRRLPADLPKLLVDPLHLEQVLGNLVINACQAMQDEGRLSISARREQDLVAITVKDTGAGITPENMQKLFEPLFTTKLKGIGLGLAVSKKLVEANGGRIQVASQPGQGTTFTLYLPVYGGS